MSIDGDRDWTNSGNSGFKSTFVLVFDVKAGRDGSTDVVFVEMTGSINSPEIENLPHVIIYYDVMHINDPVTNEKLALKSIITDGPLVIFSNLLVWVRSFGINTTIGVDVSETLVHGTTVASHVAFGL